MALPSGRTGRITPNNQEVGRPEAVGLVPRLIEVSGMRVEVGEAAAASPFFKRESTVEEVGWTSMWSARSA